MSVRVLIEARGTSAAERWVGVLRLAAFGEGASQVTEDQQPASLAFSARYLSNPRRPQGSFAEFATLEGSVRLLEGGKARFEGTLPQTSGDEQRTGPELVLEGDESSVSLAEAFHVPFPEPPASARFLEIGVELRVGGAVEASVEQNDVFDIVGFPGARAGSREVSLTLFDHQRKPLANTEIALAADGFSATESTDADGLLKFDLPNGVRELTLTFQGQKHLMRFDRLAPLPSLVGVQGRLLALGYGCEVDGRNGPNTIAAVRAFQRDQGLRVDGDPGPVTCDALAAAFGE